MNTSILGGIMLAVLCFFSNWFFTIVFVIVLVSLISGIISLEIQNWKREKENREYLKLQMKNAKRFDLN